MIWDSIYISADALESAGRCRIKDWGNLSQEERYAFLLKRSYAGLESHTPIVTTPKGKIILARVCQGIFGCFIRDNRKEDGLVLNYLVTDYTLLRKLEKGEWTL